MGRIAWGGIAPAVRGDSGKFLCGPPRRHDYAWTSEADADDVLAERKVRVFSDRQDS